MVSSAWDRSWRRDCERVLSCLSESERSELRRSGLLSPAGRDVFLEVATQRLGLDPTYASYVLERAATTDDDRH